LEITEEEYKKSEKILKKFTVNFLISSLVAGFISGIVLSWISYLYIPNITILSYLFLILISVSISFGFFLLFNNPIVKIIHTNDYLIFTMNEDKFNK
jgi:hypothetical protein